MLKVTEKLRSKLSKPFGRVYEGKGPELVKKIEEMEKANFLVTIGDLVTLFAFQAGYRPDIAVIDYKTERKELGIEFEKEIRKHLIGYTILKVRNPQGHITEELVTSLKKAIKERNTCIVVEGEEDMSALPLALMLPEGSVLLYGIPSTGISAYVVNKEDKILISRMVEEMEEVGEDGVKRMLIGGEVNGTAD